MRTVVPGTSQRKLIRAGIRAQLMGLTRASTRVYTNREEPWDHAIDGGELPAIGIYTVHEAARLFNEAPREFERSLEVRVECILDQQDGKSGDDELDDFMQEVEALILTDETAGGTASRALYNELQVGETASGERLILVGILSLSYVYYTSVDELDDLAMNLRTIHADWRFGLDEFRASLGSAGSPLREETESPRAEDDITIP